MEKYHKKDSQCVVLVANEVYMMNKPVCTPLSNTPSLITPSQIINIGSLSADPMPTSRLF